MCEENYLTSPTGLQGDPRNDFQSSNALETRTKPIPANIDDCGGDCLDCAMKSFLFPLVVFALASCTSGGSAGTPNAESTEIPSEDTTQIEEAPKQDSAWSVNQSDFQAALRAAETEYDEFDEDTVYWWDPGVFEGVSIGGQLNYADSGEVGAGLGVWYSGDDWIFFDTLDVRADGSSFELGTFESWEKGTDVESGYVAEYATIVPNPRLDDAFAAIIQDRGSKFRLSGSDGSVEREFTSEERDAIRNWYTVYRGLEEGLIP